MPEETEATPGGEPTEAAAGWQDYTMTAEGEAERFVNRIRDLAPDWVFARPADLTRAFVRWC